MHKCIYRNLHLLGRIGINTKFNSCINQFIEMPVEVNNEIKSDDNIETSPGIFLKIIK